MKEITATQEGKQKLEEELNYLKTVKRKEVVEAIRVALGFGDLSENSEYDEAKNEQAKTEARILELEEMLKNIKLVDESSVKTRKVNVGNKVKVYNEEDDETIEYTLVGSTEANARLGKISDQSPIGQALLGAKKGQVVTVVTPKFSYNLKILEINK